MKLLGPYLETMHKFWVKIFLQFSMKNLQEICANYVSIHSSIVSEYGFKNL